MYVVLLFEICTYMAYLIPLFGDKKCTAKGQLLWPLTEV